MSSVALLIPGRESIPHERDESNPSDAEALYGDFLRRRDEEPLDFEEFCRAHPDVASSLRALHSLHGSEESLGGEGPTIDENLSSHLIDRLASRQLDVYAQPVQTGDQIGHYKLRAVVGEGGIAVVFRAQQGEQVRRIAALKILKLGMDTQQVVSRFQAELQVLSLMNYPSIARVLDAGSTDSGRPFFVMEYVPGVAITEYCDRHRLNTEQRLELFVTVCQAAHHAHQKAVIHRDLKPSFVGSGHSF